MYGSKYKKPLKKKEDFIFQDKPKMSGGTVIETIRGIRRVKGDVGLEIEVEGNKFFKKNPIPSEGMAGNVPAPWVYHKDNSLRGDDNAEYTTRGPIKFDEADGAIDTLWQAFADYGSVLDVSNRTSIHVHLNFQEAYLNRLAAFLALYFSVEELLTEWCGEHRVGNLFCMRAKDAEAIISLCRSVIVDQLRGPRPTDNLHYAGLNIEALWKFGSVEVRTMCGVTEPGPIKDWVKILRHIYELSETFPDPRGICENFSGQDAMNYIEMVLGAHSGLILNNIDMSTEEIREAAYRGIRYAQDIAYCLPWEEVKNVRLERDVFRRVTSETEITL